MKLVVPNVDIEDLGRAAHLDKVREKKEYRSNATVVMYHQLERLAPWFYTRGFPAMYPRGIDGSSCRVGIIITYRVYLTYI